MIPAREEPNGLEAEIGRLIAFFDLFDYPLTSYEIAEYLGGRFGLPEISACLEAGGIYQQAAGFYFLRGREELVRTRQRRYNYTWRKIKIARRFARLISVWPFIKMVAVANSLGQYNLRDGSDIDFFIITASRRVWLSRLFCTGLAKLLNCRPTAADKRDKICLSFYLGDDHLDIGDLSLGGADPYFYYWRRTLIPLYNKDKTYERFLELNGVTAAAGLAPSLSAPSRPRRRAWLDGLEKLAGKFQLKIMPTALTAAINNSDGVVISDSVLKLYRKDGRRAYAEKYGKKIYEVLEKNR